MGAQCTLRVCACPYGDVCVSCQDCIMITKPKAGVTSDKTGLRIRTSFPRFQYDFQVIIQENKKDSPMKSRVFQINHYFSNEGWFDDEAFEAEVTNLVKGFETGKVE